MGRVTEDLGSTLKQRPGSSGQERSSATSLFNHDIYLITVFHLEFVRGVIVLEALTVEDEAALVARESLSLAVGVHEFLELSRALDLEEDLRAILRLHLDVDVLGISIGCSCTSCSVRSLCVSGGRH